MRRTPSSGCYWGFVLCLRDTLYLFLAIAIIAYALRQIKFTQLLYFLYVSLYFLRNFYPSTLWEVDKTNFQFESLLYFAMINCDLLPFVEESQILKNIKSISDETGFSDFSLVGIDNFQIQHIELLLFIQKNHILFIIGFLIIFILLNILCLYLFSHILKSIYNQSTLRKKHNKIFMLNIVIPYGSAFLLGTSLATLFIKKILPISIIIGIITLALIYLINYLFLSKFLHFSSNLQQ